MFKKTLFIVIVIMISALSGMIASHCVFPRLATTKLFSKYEFLKKSTENVTVINKTEQIYVKEDSSIKEIADRVSAAVVNIVSYSTPGENFKNGTGEIVTSDGIIMTYASALLLPSELLPMETKSPIKYKIMTGNGDAYDAELVGVDSWSNLAFLKINASNLPIISFENDDDYKPGEKVIAIGNDAVEYQNRYSSGVLNGFMPSYNISSQALSVAEKLEGVYLTDFNAERLSVGGPVIDYSGQVIGIIGSTLKNNNLEYFEIPSDKVKKIIEKMINKKLETNPFLGAYYVSLNKSYALANGIPRETGALIFSSSGQNTLAIISGSPAQKALLQINDIITRVGDEEINPARSLSSVLYNYKKGDKVEFGILRKGEEIKIPVQL